MPEAAETASDTHWDGTAYTGTIYVVPMGTEVKLFNLQSGPDFLGRHGAETYQGTYDEASKTYGSDVEGNFLEEDKFTKLLNEYPDTYNVWVWGDSKENNMLFLVREDAVVPTGTAQTETNTASENQDVTAPAKRTDGFWAQNATGWWIQYPDGTYLVNDWFQDTTSLKWYYMGADGYMLTNTVTPDGFQLDASGAWME